MDIPPFVFQIPRPWIPDVIRSETGQTPSLVAPVDIFAFLDTIRGKKCLSLAGFEPAHLNLILCSNRFAIKLHFSGRVPVCEACEAVCLRSEGVHFELSLLDRSVAPSTEIPRPWIPDVIRSETGKTAGRHLVDPPDMFAFVHTMRL
ncbi:hypothetical protein WJX72_009184 [[Myrmecia] bisecta]|uniref:Uncharacterized protein n=1 Tax=[Myrmecia] bisecta TaxID=41462 RepID=A0AAW1QFZ9_9CHLO